MITFLLFACFTFLLGELHVGIPIAKQQEVWSYSHMWSVYKIIGFIIYCFITTIGFATTMIGVSYHLLTINYV